MTFLYQLLLPECCTDDSGRAQGIDAFSVASDSCPECIFVSVMFILVGVQAVSTLHYLDKPLLTMAALIRLILQVDPSPAMKGCDDRRSMYL